MDLDRHTSGGKYMNDELLLVRLLPYSAVLIQHQQANFLLQCLKICHDIEISIVRDKCFDQPNLFLVKLLLLMGYLLRY